MANFQAMMQPRHVESPPRRGSGLSQSDTFAVFKYVSVMSQKRLKIWKLGLNMIEHYAIL